MRPDFGLCHFRHMPLFFRRRCKNVRQSHEKEIAGRKYFERDLPYCNLTALRGAARCANKTTFLVDKCFVATIRATLAGSLGAIWQILFQCALNTHFPCVDRLRIEFETAYKFQHLVDRHAIAEHARDKFGVVPVFRIEFIRQALDGRFISAFVDKLEVVAFRTIGTDCLYNLAVRYRFGTEDTVFIIGKTGEYFVRLAIDKAYKCYPLFFVVLEADNIGFEFMGRLAT